MIEAHRYDSTAGTSEPVALDAIADAVAHPSGMLWIVAVDPERDALVEVVDQLGLNELTAEDLLEGGQRTRLERLGREFVLTVHDCELHADGIASTEVDLAFGAQWAIAVARPELRGGTDLPVQEIRDRFARQREMHGAEPQGFLLWSILDVLVDRYFVVSDAIDERMEGVEEEIFDPDDGQTTPQAIFRIQRALLDFRRNAIPVRDVVGAIIRREIPTVSDIAITHFQDVFDHVLRIGDLIESQRDVLAGLLDAHLSNINNRMNDVMKKTSSWGAILLVPTLIAGIYGMNFHEMPELRWYFGYPFALASMVLVSTVLWWRFKKSGWL